MMIWIYCVPSCCLYCTRVAPWLVVFSVYYFPLTTRRAQQLSYFVSRRKFQLTDQLWPGQPTNPWAVARELPLSYWPCHGLRALERSKSVPQPPDMRSTIPPDRRLPCPSSSRKTANQTGCAVPHFYNYLVNFSYMAPILLYISVYHRADLQTFLSSPSYHHVASALVLL